MTDTADKLWRAKAIRDVCGGISDMTLWRWIKNEGFPPPDTTIGGVRYWRESTWRPWLSARMNSSPQPEAA